MASSRAMRTDSLGAFEQAESSRTRAPVPAGRSTVPKARATREITLVSIAVAALGGAPPLGRGKCRQVFLAWLLTAVSRFEIPSECARILARMLLGNQDVNRRDDQQWENRAKCHAGNNSDTD